MGDLQAWPPLVNGGSLQVYCRPLQPPLPTNSEPSAISDENWQQAKKATEDVLRFIQPSALSEQRRKSVVEYVQRVLRKYTRTEVFPFGSVPLKTYLPDGDIDLTAFGYSNSEDSLANDVRSVLEVEEQNKDAQFEVKDVQYINAEVKLVKCLVENIVVDISFNQIGGLCTLCFLEKVDEKIGKGHLFKRSIILIKAWCYYESRILGAHHGLISTYALETMVLCVFHLFHKSLDDPLVVLYKFLDYYSKFDWESYCVSLQGPVSTSSLPELVVDPAYSNGIDLLFSKEFLKECADMFSVPPRYSESSRVFSKKHLNIVDPLKPNNNLGRSVSKGNFYRIRSAFTYGARKLGRILLLPAEKIAAEVHSFFTSTLPVVRDASPRFSDSRIIQDTEVGSTSYKDLDLDPQINGSNGTLYEEINNIKILRLDDDYDNRLQFNRIHSNQHLDGLHECAKLKNHLTEDVSILSLDRDAKHLATLEAFDLRNVDENHMAPCHDQTGVCPSGEASHAPHLLFHLENGCKNVSLDNVNSRATIKEDVSLNRSNKIPSEETNCDTEFCHTTTSWFKTNSLSVSTGSIHGSSRTNWNSNLSEYSTLADCSNEGNGNTSTDPKCIKLSDLIGDFSTHYANLRFALSLNQYTFPVHGLSPSQYQNKYPWSAFHQPGIYSHIGGKPAPPFPPAACYPSGQPLVPGVYGAKDMQKPRGTGTYFPDMNSRTYRERVSLGRGKNQMSPNQLSRSHSNGRVDVQQDRYLPEEGSNGALSQPYSPVFCGNDCGKPASSDVLQSSRSGTSFGNGFVHHLDGKLEFGSLGPVPLRVSSSEQSSQLESVTPCSQNPATTTLAPTVPSSSMGLKCERAIQQYQLKDESDFPPL